MKKFLNALLCFSMLCIPCMTAKAVTVDEAAAVAHEYGYTDDEIQQALNEYYAHPDDYTEDDIQYAIDKIKSSGRKIVGTVPYNPDAKTPVSEVTTAVAADDNSSDSNTSSDTSKSSDITLSAPDGTEFTRISKEEFIDLSYEQKIEYLSTFTEDIQQVIIDNLSPEEYRSMMKQLPAEQKADVINNLAEATDKLGVQLTVEEISDDKVQVAMKDSEGTLVGVVKAGNTVENTGYDRRGIFAVSGLLFVLAFSGITAVMRKSFGRKEADNEQ